MQSKTTPLSPRESHPQLHSSGLVSGRRCQHQRGSRMPTTLLNGSYWNSPFVSVVIHWFSHSCVSAKRTKRPMTSTTVSSNGCSALTSSNSFAARMEGQPTPGEPKPPRCRRAAPSWGTMNKKMTVTLRRQGTHYVIEKLTNTTSVRAFDGDTLRSYRVGDRVSESAAESLASKDFLEVTIQAARR
jgi:hypothetical protein